MKSRLLITLLLCSVVLTSCLKKQDLSSDDLGPAIDPLELTRALGSGIGSYDFNEIKPNENTRILVSQKIQDNGAPTPIEQQDITVKNVSNTPEKLQMDLIVHLEQYSGGNTSQSTREWPIVLNKSSAQETDVEGKSIRPMADANPPTLMFLTFNNLAFNSCYDSGQYPESCHNLTVNDVKYKVPMAAAGQHNCADATKCYIDAKKIEFDLIRKYQLDQDGKPKRIHFKVLLSPHVPFLSRVLQVCTRSLYEITDSEQKILADICYSVNNYSAGTTP